MANRACKNCSLIYEGDKCPNCGSQEYLEDIKGTITIFDAEKSEIAKNIKLNKKGKYLIRSR
ncbi:DNA-directed RNA polymerase subunit E'' [Candidatus Pacearchaeota archaeon]|nr:DNA-directed RNA polymerase subunit E'' [Candidatus Pacearchaeota archaeon]